MNFLKICLGINDKLGAFCHRHVFCIKCKQKIIIIFLLSHVVILKFNQFFLQKKITIFWRILKRFCKKFKFKWEHRKILIAKAISTVTFLELKTENFQVKAWIILIHVRYELITTLYFDICICICKIIQKRIIIKFGHRLFLLPHTIFFYIWNLLIQCT